MNDKEFKVVTRQETFKDLAVRELARGRSACICRLQFGKCKEAECKKCEIGLQYAHCYSELSEYDKQRLATYINEQYLQDSMWPSKWQKHEAYIAQEMRQFLWLALWFIVGFALFGLLLCVIAEAPDSCPPGPINLQDKIVTTMLTNQNAVCDYNQDGTVNCVDYACGFKYCWDLMYPELSGYCQIVRNKNPNGLMHHLFVRIGRDIDIEPWAPDPFIYSMDANWPNGEYDQRYNIYGETDLWMTKCLKKLNQNVF